MRIRRHQNRSGNFLVLTAFLMVGMFAMLAFAVDLGYIQVVDAELARAADAATLAATWELLDQTAEAAMTGSSVSTESIATVASQYAISNKAGGVGPSLASEDVAVGRLDNPGDLSAPITLNVPNPNAVRIRVRKTEGQNGEIPLFFARALGVASCSQQTESTAMFLDNVSGFAAPTPDAKLGILPFALDLDTWNDLLAGIGSDDWTWNEELQQVTSGPDGILEANLFPQGTGSPGNRGTVDIGSNNNSTADITRQILEGVNAADLEYHGGKIELDENGELVLNGDTGISAGVKDELEAVKGQGRIVLLFSQVSGPGNNAQYTIVHFAGIRIMKVKLTGNMTSKCVVVQPATVIICGGILGGSTPTSNFIYSPVWLVR